MEGSVRLRDGRSLGFAEFGPRAGRPLLWFHGTPGARRQIAPEARRLAYECGVRIVSIERPGIGDSTSHRYGAVLDFAADIEQLCDGLGVDRFAVVGLSGGGPYALACGHRMPERVVSVTVLGGVAPAVGEDAVAGGVGPLVRVLAPWLGVTWRPLGSVLRGLVLALEPLANQAIDLFAMTMPPGDQRVFEDAATRFMFKEDIVVGSRHRMEAVLLDAQLFAREWGFSLSELRVPVRLRYGDADVIVPLTHGLHLAERIPGAEISVHPGEGHLGGLGASREIFDAVLAAWPKKAAK
jgi:pimeloyl-ACP methyl ester carboxylesterase